MGSKSYLPAKLCPECYGESFVRRSITAEDGSIIRERICKSCGAKYKTEEIFLHMVDVTRQRNQ